MQKFSGSGPASAVVYTIPFDGEYQIELAGLVSPDPDGDAPRFRLLINNPPAAAYLTTSLQDPPLASRVNGLMSRFLNAGDTVEYSIDQTATNPTWEFSLAIRLADDLV